MIGLHALSISVRADQGRVADELCKAGIECGPVESISYFLLLVSAGFLVLFSVATVVHLRNAKDTVVEEQSRTRAEYEAFGEFTRNVAAIDPPATDGGFAISGGPALLLTESTTYTERPAAMQLQRISDLYETTVMSVPHYEEDYDDSLESSMTAELGEDITSAILHGTEFTPHLKHAVVNRARDAQRQRKELLGGLEREAEELAHAVSEINQLAATIEPAAPERLHQQSFPELAKLWDHLGGIEDRCTQLIAERQAHITDHRLNGSPVGSGHTFYEYLYQSLPVEYPVLADATTLLSSVRQARRRVIRGLTTRV